MAIVPRQQVVPFTVLAGQTLDLTTYTKYDHDKVVGVVLLPDKAIFGDRIFLEINKECVLPRGFNAGLISFRQFLNKEMKRNVYQFEEWAKGSEIRVIYRNNDKRSVNIDLVLLTVQGDDKPITQRKKLQIIPVHYTAFPKGNTYEPAEVRTKTDFYFQELIGIFNDHFNFVSTVYDSYIASGEIGQIIRDYLKFLELPAANTAEEKKAKKEKATALQTRIKDLSYIPQSIKDLTDAVKKSLSDYLDDTTAEPTINQKNLFALQESIETFELYNDNYRTLSTLEMNIGGRPIYPENYPIANVIPRYRKSFNETMYRISMQVQEADVFIRFAYQAVSTTRAHVPQDFAIYLMYHQKSDK